jgi:hypothetical protein
MRDREETMFQICRLSPFAALAILLSCAMPSSSETIIDEWPNVKAPPPPELKSVRLDPKTTALIEVLRQCPLPQ